MEFNQPACLKLTGNLNDNFQLFKREVLVYLTASETNTKSQEVQVARILNLFGSDGLKWYNSFNIGNFNIKYIFKQLEEYCIPTKKLSHGALLILHV